MMIVAVFPFLYNMEEYGYNVVLYKVNKPEDGVIGQNTHGKTGRIR